jgi:hypothetical protein
MARSITLGAREIPDDLLLGVGRMEFAVDGGEGAEKQTAGIGHDRRAAGSDFITGQEFVEFAERVVDGHGGSKFLSVTDEGGGEIGAIALFPQSGGVFEAEAGLRVGDGHAAKAPAGGRAVLAMEQAGARDRGFEIHGSSFVGRIGVHPGSFRKSGKQRR